MSMRLGKTLVSIRSSTAAQVSQRFNLIVCPIEGMWSWKRELEKESWSYTVLDGSADERNRKLKTANGGFYILNFEGLKSVCGSLSNMYWNAIIVDESRRIANPKNVSTKILQSLPRSKGQVRQVLSGEPAPESPLEYFEQLRFVYGNAFGFTNYWSFRNAYFYEVAPHEWVLKRELIDSFKRDLHDLAFFMTWKEAGIKQTKINEVRTVQLPPKIRRIYDGIKEEFVARLEEKTVETKWLPVQYGWLHQLSSGWFGNELLWKGKINALEDLLESELRSEQVVVWFKYNAPLRYCLQNLTRKRISVGGIYGAESRSQREATIDAFRSGRHRVLLCQIKCAKTAIDLSNASTSIYFANSPSNEERKQSEARIAHPLKKKANLYIDLLAEETVEEDILEALKSKRQESAFYWSKFLINRLAKGDK